VNKCGKTENEKQLCGMKKRMKNKEQQNMKWKHLWKPLSRTILSTEIWHPLYNRKWISSAVCALESRGGKYRRHKNKLCETNYVKQFAKDKGIT
jgi:hypothetical protein